MSLTRVGKFRVECSKCGYQGTNMLHKCEPYKIKLDDEVLTVWARHPEHACEILSNHMSKELYLKIGSTEYMTEKIDNKYVASVAFEAKS